MERTILKNTTSENAVSKREPKIPVGCKQKNRFIPIFIIVTVILTAVSLIYLNIDWMKLASRVPEIGEVFYELAHFDFSNMDQIFSSILETVSIAVLSLLYSLVLGIVFGMLAARNIFRIKWLSVLTQSLFTFLLAVPTPVWVLLMLVCLGMGPEAGVAGLCVHTTAFFTKSFAQSFESIPAASAVVVFLHVRKGARRLSSLSKTRYPCIMPEIPIAPTVVSVSPYFSFTSALRAAKQD